MEQARFETSAAAIQDTTKKSAPSRPELRTPEQGKISPLPHLKTHELPLSLHVDDLELTPTTLEQADSLARLHPEIRDFLLKQVVIQGGLAIDKAEFEKRKMLRGLFKDLKLYGEMEAEMRRNQARYGTINNPLRPPPMPNQINLLDVIPAVSNILHALGLK
jgi:hypothetical protein